MTCEEYIGTAAKVDATSFIVGKAAFQTQSPAEKTRQGSCVILSVLGSTMVL